MPSERASGRRAVADSRAKLAVALQRGDSIGPVLRRYSEEIDRLVRAAFQAATRRTPTVHASLMAVGGYGRAELAPHSDVDLLFLHAPASRQALKPLLEGMLYPLWDAGLDVSCSARMIAECLQLARTDLRVKTGLVDGRYLAGSGRCWAGSPGRRSTAGWAASSRCWLRTWLAGGASTKTLPACSSRI
jgi:[protein-PII] uridylyltransferase